MIHTAIVVLHLCVCIMLVGIVLLQQGKGADAGAAFGGGANTVFGASGADNFLTKATTILAFLFMTTSFVLTLQGNSALSGTGSRLFKDAPAKATAPVETHTENSIVGTSATSSPTTVSTPAAAGEATVVAPISEGPAAGGPTSLTPALVVPDSQPTSSTTTP